jgi:hypothetical protein
MRRSFSKELEEDREFEIGGEVFKFVYPHWKEGAELFDRERQSFLEAQEAQNGGPVQFSFVEDTENAIKQVPMFLDPAQDSHSRWAALVERTTDPVPRHQITDLAQWLVTVTSGFPTQQPLDSSSGDGNSEESSAAEES